MVKQQQFWLEALNKSLEHWKDNLKRFNEADWEKWIASEVHFIRDKLNGIDMSSEACDCCKFQQSMDCYTPCPLCPKPIVDSLCGECCSEWTAAVMAVYYRKDREAAYMAIQKMIEKIRSAIEQVRLNYEFV